MCHDPLWHAKAQRVGKGSHVDTDHGDRQPAAATMRSAPVTAANG
jgi:hypothetical protein